MRFTWCKTTPPIGAHIRTADPNTREQYRECYVVGEAGYSMGRTVLWVVPMIRPVGAAVEQIRWPWSPKYDSWKREVPE